MGVAFTPLRWLVGDNAFVFNETASDSQGSLQKNLFRLFLEIILKILISFGLNHILAARMVDYIFVSLF